MIITHKIKMDMARPWIMPAVEVMQDDKYSRNIEFTLTQNGTDLQIPEGTTAIVRFCKPDGTGGNYDKLPDGTAAYTIIGNVVTIALAPQVCTASGKVLLTACLINDATELHTFSVRINVNRNPGLVTQSENYFKIAGALADSGWEPNSLLETDGSGNVVAKKSSYVKTVNGVAPDANGNVEIEATLDEDTSIASFKNSAGVTLFTLDLSGLGSPATYGEIVLSTDNLEVAESGSNIFTVALATAPTANQPVYLAVSDNTKISVSPSTLTFTTTNWAEPQTVTVTAAQDDDKNDESIVVTLTSRKVSAKQISVSVTDNYWVPELVTDGLVLHFDYRGHQDDTSTTITDLASGVTATNFNLFGKTEDGINGGDNNSAYKYLTLQTTDDPFAAFLTDMKNGQGFTLESFGTVCKRSFTFSKNLYDFGAGYAFGVGGILIGNKTQPTCILADGTTSNTAITLNQIVTVDGVTLNLGQTAQASKVPNWNNFLHVVTTYSPDGTIHRYFNGYGVNESTTIENFASWDFDTMLSAPSMLSTSNLGTDDTQYVSSQRIYNRVLTEDEIRMNMAVEASRMGLTTF